MNTLVILLQKTLALLIVPDKENRHVGDREVRDIHLMR